MKLTPEQYVAKQGVCCPSCDKQTIEGQEVNIEEGGAWQEIHCLSCDATWVDQYKLIGYSQLETNT